MKGIILDYGGTLDTNGIHWSKVIQDGWKQAGVLVEEPLFREAYVFGEQELERSLVILDNHNFSDLMRMKINIELQYLVRKGYFSPDMVESKSQEIADYCYNIAKEGVQKSVPVLESLSNRFPLVIVSNFYGNLETVLKDFGILKYFKKVIDSAKVGMRKPGESIFNLALKEFNCEPSEILVVGDSLENDILPAKKLGFSTLWLKSEKTDNSEIPDSDIKTMKSFEDILSFVEGE